MTDKTVSELLKENPQATEIRNYNNADYIPIGQVEEILDSMFVTWGTSDFKFQIIRTDKYWFADASVTLWVSYPDNTHRTLTGAVTFHISSKDVNMDYSGTALSLCISNAAKKLGKRFGRGLNNRLTVGDVLPVIKVEKKVPVDEEKRRAQLLIEQATDIEKLQKEWYPLAKSKKLMPVYNKKLRELKKIKELSK